jgi:glycosyltransferase involved in cell wall biosynthesis
VTTTVVIPTYNEVENLSYLVSEILKLDIQAHVIIVDDNSPDGTGQLADELAAQNGRVQVVHRPGKLGLGTAYIAGFEQALAEEAVDQVVTMDADFSHNPRYIPALVSLTQQHHLSIGSRYVPGGGVTADWGVHRKFLSWGANHFTRLMLGLTAHDCTAGFRCYRREVLQSIELDRIFSNGYSFLIEMLYKCQRMGYRIGETPITFENRHRGDSKISQAEIFKAMYTVLRLAAARTVFRRRARLHSPPHSAHEADRATERGL